MAKIDPQVLAHLEWIGFVRPTGLVVSAPALVRAGAILDRRDADGQRLLRECAEEREFNSKDGSVPYLPDFQSFASTVLGWRFSPKGYSGTEESPVPDELTVPLPDYGETLRPDFAVREMDPSESGSEWQLLVRVLEVGQEFDSVVRGKGRLEASPLSRMERLLRQTQVPAGLLFNGQSIRLVSAPRGESSGWVDFKVADMVQTAGRPICTALRLLLSEQRLLALPRAQRLAALLNDSRKFQNEVSERLAEQVLHALYELLRGFQSAHDASKCELLRHPLEENPDDVYRALLTVILRLVFVLYAEERDMLPEDETFLRNYSLAGLYDRLREDAALYPDTMEQRFGAWAQLLVLFRMIFDGAGSDNIRLPRRHGVLFDPDRFPFLEGRSSCGARQIHERIEPPLVPDGTIYRALEKLLVLDSERISYRALDVEQIGSVYETMMGFRLEQATGRSVAIKASKKHGAPTAIDLEALLSEPIAKREKWVKDRTDRKLSERVKKATKGAATVEDLHAALLPVVDLAASPDLVPKGAMTLQPSEERRRSGSHYTPRTLTEPIVRRTLEPILARLKGQNGHPPRPDQIIEIKVCDLAMGSGAFLVETCRQLGQALVEAWHVHNNMPEIPPDEDEVVLARRLIAQRCLYGVDRNPVAVDLAKVSLWLVTLAKDHALTFLDHALRHGDSLIGLSRKQIEAFHWKPGAPHFSAGLEAMRIREHVDKIAKLRGRIRDAAESVSDWRLRDLWDQTQYELEQLRLFGDLVIAAFFEGANANEREAKRSKYATLVLNGDAESQSTKLEEWQHANQPLVPFHWEIEFPEVFDQKPSGFDAIIGNPPFLGGARISTNEGMPYFSFLRNSYPPAGHQCDLVGYFFRRSYNLLGWNAALGLIATNTVAQGDTRNGALVPIISEDGVIYNVQTRVQWPGRAAVIVSVLHISKGCVQTECILNSKPVTRISAYLVEGSVDTSPRRLNSAAYFSKGSQIYGQGFLFDDTDAKANSIESMQRIIEREPQSKERIFPFIGGAELNSQPVVAAKRYVIYLSDLASEADLDDHPAIAEIVRERVKPERDKLGDNPNNIPLKRKWWAYQAHRPELYARARARERMLAHAEVSKYLCFRFVPAGWIFNKTAIILDLDSFCAFGVLQSRVHETWTTAFASSLKDDLRYTASDCFATFAFPKGWQTASTLEDAAREYYEYRAALMDKHDEGLTKTYNRFHDPDERDPEIMNLRKMHAATDQAVLDTYGWSDISIDCEFLLDYEIDDEDWSPRRKKPWRYRWPDEVRDQVLARLLGLNAERAKEEVSSGLSAKKKDPKKERAKKKSVKQGTSGQKELF